MPADNVELAKVSVIANDDDDTEKMSKEIGFKLEMRISSDISCRSQDIVTVVCRFSPMVEDEIYERRLLQSDDDI